MQLRKILVQTVDTVRYTYLLDKAVTAGYPILLCGPTGTGKSVYILQHLNSLDSSSFAPPLSLIHI